MDFIHQAGNNAMYPFPLSLASTSCYQPAGHEDFLQLPMTRMFDGSELLLACFFALMTAHISAGSYCTTPSKTSKMKGSTGLTFIRAQLVFMLSALLSNPRISPWLNWSCSSTIGMQATSHAQWTFVCFSRFSLSVIDLSGYDLQLQG